MCTDTEVAEFVWVLDKWEGCAYLKAVRVYVCVSVRVCLCVRQIGWVPPVGKVLAIAGA